jgi:hypothetical protein
MSAAAACNAANCTVVEVLQATNETFAACGVPIRDQTATLIGVTASFGFLALTMVMLRLADRAISAQAQLGWDDLLIGLSGVRVGLLSFWRCFCLILTAAYVARNEHTSYRGRSPGLRS